MMMMILTIIMGHECEREDSLGGRNQWEGRGRRGY
jgi:hypothetical protein